MAEDVANPLPWECEYCGARYAEYINGCPKCWMGEPGTASSVRLVETAPTGDGPAEVTP